MAVTMTSGLALGYWVSGMTFIHIPGHFCHSQRSLHEVVEASGHPGCFRLGFGFLSAGPGGDCGRRNSAIGVVVIVQHHVGPLSGFWETAG